MKKLIHDFFVYFSNSLIVRYILHMFLILIFRRINLTELYTAQRRKLNRNLACDDELI